jgi:hypothetical protein
MTHASVARTQAVPSLLFACLLAAGAASAQTATSTVLAQTSGTIGTLSGAATVAAGATSENINCTGTVKIVATVVSDPSLPPGAAVFLDARGLSCVGATSNTTYLNTGIANLTRPLAALDVIKMTFALYPNTPGGYMKARTGMLTANLTYNTLNGALLSAAVSIGNFQ